MKKTFISLFVFLYCALLVSASFEAILKNYQVTTEIDWSQCSEIPEDSEEPSAEDNREWQDDETCKFKGSYSFHNFRTNKGNNFSLCLFTSGSHFPEIDSPPPQA
ncbi:MAG: hypothetical protein JNL53_00805 [Cyclobacteriaceae bacterium]|nr:hypothetical protein [Cyclobacteriaceae bacterium]